MKATTSKIMGRPKITIEKDDLIALYNEFGNWDDVAQILGVSKMTLNRRQREYKINITKLIN